MALYIDDTQIAPADLAAKLGISKEKFERLIKKPSFKLDESQIPKKMTIKSNLLTPPVQGIKASFWFKDKADDLDKKLRWAESRSPKVEGGVMTYEYKPGYINISGKMAAFVGHPDKALFMYLQPGNPLSPFAANYKLFSFIDPVAETLKLANNMSNLQKALQHASTCEEEELVLIAKGLRLLKTDDYDPEELRLQLQQFAINPATNKLYIDGMDNEVVRIEGRIINLIDKKIVVLEKRGSARQWTWAKGERQGETIGQPIMNPNDDAKQRLLNIMKSDLGNYLNDLRNSTVDLHADRKAKEVLDAEKVQVPSYLAELNGESGGKALKDEVFDLKSAQDFVVKKGYNKLATNVKQLREAVSEDRVTYENVDNFLTSLYAK